MGIIIKGDVKGDIISEGGVKNETHYHYGDEHRVEQQMQKTETHVEDYSRNQVNAVQNNITAPTRQAIVDELLALADKGEWTRGVTGDDIKAMLRQVLEQSDMMWQLLERGRGDRLRVVWQNLTGYFVDRRLLPTTIGAPALNKMFFGDDNGYTNIDKGRPSKRLMTADFGSLVPLLDKYVPRVDKKP